MTTGRVSHTLARLEAAVLLHPKELLAANVRAKNRAVASVRTEAVRLLRPLFPGLKAGSIRRQLKITWAKAKDPRAILEFSAKRFRLFGNFNARQTKRGVRAPNVWRLETLDGVVVPAQILAHAFIQRGRASGVPHVGVRMNTRRYPITTLQGSSLATTFRSRYLGDILLNFGRRRFRIVLDQEMRYRIAKGQPVMDWST